MSESSIRFERTEGFAVLYNSLVRDPRLSLKTLGLMARIIALPATWHYSVSGLAKVNGVGKDAIRSSLKELEAAGYLMRERAREPDGTLGGTIYTILERSNIPLSENTTMVPDELEDEPMTGNPPQVQPSSENPTLAKPTQVSPTQYSKDISSKDLSHTPISPKGGRRGKELSREVKDLLNGYVGHDKALADAMVTLMEIRTEHKATNSVRAVKSLLDKLNRLSGGDRRQKLLILEQSNATGKWLSVFPLREGGRGSPPQEEVEPVVI